MVEATELRWRPVGAEGIELADIITAYVAPELTLTPDPQRYTRIADTTYRYESRDSDFTRDIVVDAEGFVVDYPGLFLRA